MPEQKDAEFFTVRNSHETWHIRRESVLAVKMRGERGKPVGWPDNLEACLTLAGGHEVGLCFYQWAECRKFLGIENG